MTYSEDELLQLSGLQHFAFRRRQWALIHIEQLWAENLRTVEGTLLYQRAHDEKQRERRGDTLILRNLSISSKSLGLSGQCDAVEFHAHPDGITLHGESGVGFLIRWSTNGARRSLTRRMNSSSVPKLCAWRKSHIIT